MISIKLILVELASGGHSEHVPFASVKSDTSQFIEDVYLPSEPIICLTDPHNMKKQEILDFLEHVKERQVRYGPEAAFRFRAYHRKHSLHPAIYLDKVGCGPMELDGEEVVNQVPEESHEIALTQPCLPSASETEVPQTTSLMASHRPATPDSIRIANADGMVIVNHEQMMGLVSHGMDSLQPVNGPNEGEPHYIVPAAALMYLDRK
jgi:hypothetical protein